MKIARVQTAVVETEMPNALVVSHGTAERRVGHVIVGLWADDGTTGVGEASPLTFFTGETVASVRAVIDGTLGPRTIGADPRAMGALLARLDEGLPGGGRERPVARGCAAAGPDGGGGCLRHQVREVMHVPAGPGLGVPFPAHLFP